MIIGEQQIDALAQKLGDALQQKDWHLVTAESCTGGWIAKVVTDVAGCSAWFERGFITYSNQAKRDMLGVDAAVLDRWGAVSEQTVLAMVAGALDNSSAKLAVAVSGIAGPDGGSADKPVGTVYIAWGGMEVVSHARLFQFKGDRKTIRAQAVIAALQGLIASCE